MYRVTVWVDYEDLGVTSHVKDIKSLTDVKKTIEKASADGVYISVENFSLTLDLRDEIDTKIPAHRVWEIKAEKL